MTMTDPVADMLTRIRNANVAHHDTVDVPCSKMKKSIAEILLAEGYIKNFEIIENGPQATIHIEMKYGAGKEKVISGIKRSPNRALRSMPRRTKSRRSSAVSALPSSPLRTASSATRKPVSSVSAAKSSVTFGRRPGYVQNR